MKIYTRTGDRGETGIIGGSRVSKDNLIIEVCGTLDEVNSLIGIARAQPLPGKLDSQLDTVQADLFIIGSQVAGCTTEPNSRSVGLDSKRVAQLEQHIDEMNETLQPMDAFILPGGNVGAATIHLARTVCRRAERILVTLISQNVAVESSRQPLEKCLVYLNRLSDFLFVAARQVNHVNDVAETKWLPKS